jgi:hypothetical protein
LRSVRDTICPAHAIPISRDTEPNNEFTDNANNILTLFPHVYLFGRIGDGFEGKGTMPASLVEHWMLQGSNQFAAERRLLFLLFNQKIRHAACSAVSVKAVNNKVAIDKFAAYATDQDLKDKMDFACSHPTSTEAKEIVKEFESFMRITGKEYLTPLL